MTAKIFCKDLRLAAHPMMYVFAFFGAMLLIPSYPYTVAFFYGLLGIFFTFLNGRENKDVYYCAVLPVTKREQVRARTWMVVAVELTELVLAVPFAILSVHINPNGTNLAGIDANVALFGAVLLIFGVFNAVFLPAFYKTAVRVGRSFLLAVVPMTALMALVEALSHFPVVGPYLDAVDAAGQVRQLPVLAAGAATFALLSWLAFRRAAKTMRASICDGGLAGTRKICYCEKRLFRAAFPLLFLSGRDLHEEQTSLAVGGADGAGRRVRHAHSLACQRGAQQCRAYRADGSDPPAGYPDNGGADPEDL